MQEGKQVLSPSLDNLSFWHRCRSHLIAIPRSAKASGFHKGSMGAYLRLDGRAGASPLPAAPFPSPCCPAAPAACPGAAWPDNEAGLAAWGGAGDASTGPPAGVGRSGERSVAMQCRRRMSGVDSLALAAPSTTCSGHKSRTGGHAKLIKAGRHNCADR